MSGNRSEAREYLRAGIVLAAGMITSPLGLAEVPHVAAPAGITELASAPAI